MSFVGFLLDENVDPAIRSGLKQRWPEAEIWLVGDPGAPSRGTPDPELLAWCELVGYVLVTNNRASMPGHLTDHLVAGGHSPGILVPNPNLSIGATIEALALIWVAGEPGEFLDQIRYLPGSA